jgi:hypothetical protein
MTASPVTSALQPSTSTTSPGPDGMCWTFPDAPIRSRRCTTPSLPRNSSGAISGSASAAAAAEARKPAGVMPI